MRTRTNLTAAVTASLGLLGLACGSPASQRPDGAGATGGGGAAGLGSAGSGGGSAGEGAGTSGTGGDAVDAAVDAAQDSARDVAVDAPVEVPSGPGITVIQEDQIGFDAVDGKVFPRQGSTSITGYTGTGFSDGDPGTGKTISWSVKADAAVTARFIWRYAFGGAADNLRDAALFVNGVVVAPSVAFPYTTAWTEWHETAPLDVPLDTGPSFIQLRALGPGGLSNIDYLEIVGDGITPDTPSFSLTVNASDPAGGTVSYAPVQAFYPYGASVTITAVASPGYFFQSWTGDAPSAKPSATFPMVKNTTVTARFLPNGTTQDPAVLGYATVQDDQGTPYLLNGGSLGPSVTATTIDELKSYLGSPDPYVVSFSGLYTGPDNIKVSSNKTLLGVGTTAHLDGIELQINGSRNVIIRNVTVSNVVADGSGVANDAIEITGGARNIWIDHCELYSDLEHDKDYYDGLLDIKNESSFITVSWCAIHDHWKASLISSGDEQVADTVIRATYHHNYFYNCGSRLPSIRFGKAHMFGNYYKDNTTGSCVNSRMGAVVKVDNNAFENSKNPIGFSDSAFTGTWDVGNNVFTSCTGSQPTTSTGQLTPPYPYPTDVPADLPTSIPAGAGVGKL